MTGLRWLDTESIRQSLEAVRSSDIMVRLVEHSPPPFAFEHMVLATQKRRKQMSHMRVEHIPADRFQVGLDFSFREDRLPPFPKPPPGLDGARIARPYFRELRRIMRDHRVHGGGVDQGIPESMVFFAPPWFTGLMNAAERMPPEWGRHADMIELALRSYSKDALETIYTLRGSNAFDALLVPVPEWRWADGRSRDPLTADPEEKLSTPRVKTWVAPHEERRR